MTTITKAADRRFKPGDTVRLSEQLEAEWVTGRIAAGHLPGQPFGRISSKPIADEHCGTCEHDGEICAGPFYAVDDVGQSGLAGVYAEHELRALADPKWTKPRHGSGPLHRRPTGVKVQVQAERCEKCWRPLDPVKYHDCGEQAELF